MLTGKHYIAGQWLGSETEFSSQPAYGTAQTFAAGTAALVNQAARAAEAAFWSYSQTSRHERAAFLNRIADELDARGADLTRIGSQESGLPAPRLEGERGRTTGQLRLFAKHIEQGDYLDRRHDVALPDRQPLPRPELRLMQRPLGPVAVFGASNFPLAFSVAGGDTAAALAAGCPVVVKGHEAHPGTGELAAQAIAAAVAACHLHPGIFSLVQGGSIAVGQALVQHPLIQAVGFTGSLRAGRALFDLCAQRPEPIPFFGELGAVNPVFLLPQALKQRGTAIANAWVGSLTLGVGQFCTNPGVVILPEGAAAEAFLSTVQTGLAGIDGQTMLTSGIAQAYQSGTQRMQSQTGVTALLTHPAEAREAFPHLLLTTGDTWLANPSLGEEVFGPLGLVVTVRDHPQMLDIAHSLHGQLTCTLHMEQEDVELARALLPVLERKAGRILANGFPTGVEVCDAMVHGGPYPASTNFGASSVGTLAIRRFLRPVCYQNLSEALLPPDTLQT